MENTDIVIIGAGMAGLTAAIYLRRANANFIIIDGDGVGGRLNSLKEVDNYPGFKKSSGEEIKKSLLDQIESLDIKVQYGKVQSILKEPVGFKVISDVASISTKAIILASGFNQVNKLIPGEKEYLGRGVSYCATCDGSFFKDDDVMVYGNNDIALEEALYLANIVKKLYLVVADEKLFGNKSLLDQIMKQNNVEIILHVSPIEIRGDDFGVNQVELSNGRSIPVHGVFPYSGSKTAGVFLNNLKPTMLNNFIVTDEAMQSDIPGLFAAGDIRSKTLRQLVTAASDGAIAALEANKFVKNK